MQAWWFATQAFNVSCATVLGSSPGSPASSDIVESEGMHQMISVEYLDPDSYWNKCGSKTLIKIGHTQANIECYKQPSWVRNAYTKSKSEVIVQGFELRQLREQPGMPHQPSGGIPGQILAPPQVIDFFFTFFLRGSFKNIYGTVFLKASKLNQTYLLVHCYVLTFNVK
jgi:hypothetical protein